MAKNNSFTLPDSLLEYFEVVGSCPSARVFQPFRVVEKKPGGREFMIRLLPDTFSSDKGLVEAFHEFFTRFSEISNKAYIAQVHSVVGAVNGPVYVLEEFVSGISLNEFVEKKKDAGDLRRDAINVIARVCEALHYAHQKDIFPARLNWLISGLKYLLSIIERILSRLKLRNTLLLNCSTEILSAPVLMCIALQPL